MSFMQIFIARLVVVLGVLLFSLIVTAGISLVTTPEQSLYTVFWFVFIGLTVTVALVDVFMKG